MSRFQVQTILVVILAILSIVSVTLGMSGCATTRPASDYDVPTISCPEGSQIDLRSGVCKSVCYESQKYDASSKSCISVCGAGYEWDGRKCVSVCVGETTWDGLNQACVCPVGKLPTKMGRCLTPEELRCEEEKATKAAVERAAQLAAERKAYAEAHPAPKCKAGTKWDMFVGQCITICKGGQWNDAQATCLCPQGQEWVPVFKECVPKERLEREPSGPHGPRAND